MVSPINQQTTVNYCIGHACTTHSLRLIYHFSGYSAILSRMNQHITNNQNVIKIRQILMFNTNILYTERKTKSSNKIYFSKGDLILKCL